MLYKIKKEENNLNREDILSIIRLLSWANASFRDGNEAKKHRSNIVEKMKKILEGADY
tara:strand:- start:662 stop:835 length:174 start_codon:yes stop_codon:yes gene_type:complete